MRLIKLTPHTLNIADVDGNYATVKPSGTVARVEVKRELDRTIYTANGAFTVDTVTYKDITGLPNPEEGIVYVVSTVVRMAADREDVVSPGELIRDEAGQPIGCKGLSR